MIGNKRLKFLLVLFAFIILSNYLFYYNISLNLGNDKLVVNFNISRNKIAPLPEKVTDAPSQSPNPKYPFVSFTGIENDTTYYVKFIRHSAAVSSENLASEFVLKTNRPETDFTSKELNETEYYDSCEMLNPLPRYRIVNFEPVNVITEKCTILLLTNVSKSGQIYFEPPSLNEISTCCVREKVDYVATGKKPKKRAQNVCRPMNETIQLKPNEFSQVVCSWKMFPTSSNTIEYKTYFGPKPTADAKVEFWSEIAKQRIRYRYGRTTQQQPKSIILLGVSTLSRNQASQTLTQTNQFMKKEMIFNEYMNYFQPGQGIPENLYPILTGKTLYKCLQRNESSGTYNRTKDCNSLLEFYNTLNYVTMFGMQEEISAFNNEADYDLNQFLSIYGEGMESEESDQCFQYNILFQIFSYITQFLETYQKTPYFLTLWFDSYPHLGESNLQRLDYILVRFFRNILPYTKDNTMIIFMSEGGFYSKTNLNAEPQDPHSYTYQFFENQYPMVKIYYPDISKLFLNYGQPNQHTLISYHEIYQTILYNVETVCEYLEYDALMTASQTKPIFSENKMEPFKLSEEMSKFCSRFIPETGKTITTLWDSLFSQRTCDMILVEPKMCMCNTRIIRNPSNNFSSQIVENAIDFVISKLNQYIEDSFPINSTEENPCSMWILGPEGIKAKSTVVSTVLINPKNGTLGKSKDLLLTFNAQPAQWNKDLGMSNTHFQSIVRFHYNKTDVASNDTDYSMELLQFPIRILEHGGSWRKESKCVQNRNDARLSRICYCTKPNLKLTHLQCSECGI